MVLGVRSLRQDKPSGNVLLSAVPAGLGLFLHRDPAINRWAIFGRPWRDYLGALIWN